MRISPVGKRCIPFEVLAKACGHKILVDRMTPKQAARKWKKSAETIRRWCRQGRIPFERVGRTIEIPADAKPPKLY